ncbi:MAG TPA: DUF1844 domain-containing protein [Fimbriimonadales bacterium]|jgi:hypothetical protein|nr:DUF1844 domain-containing protein [Fimbriimonadales bacterium]
MPEESSDKPLSVYDLISFSLDQFAQVAWQKMGLRPDPMTGKEDVDLEQAKVAIDMASRLGEVLDPQLDDEDRRKIQGILSDLRINFVRRTGS